MKRILTAAIIALTSAVATTAQAETCGGTYTVQSGDSLSAIADKMYKDAGKWSAIHSNNLNTIGPKPNRITVGMRLNLTCIAGLPIGLEGGVELEDVQLTSAPVQVAPGTAANRKKINLLTGTDYAPFTHLDLHNGGMLTDVVNAAFAESAPNQGYAIHWVNDWTAHFEPLLSNALLDAGFPWRKPDCESAVDNYRCDNLLFSDPMFEMLILLFTAKDGTMIYNRDADIVGKTLCRPVGYSYADMDRDGRNWLKEEKITLLTPRTVKDCFDAVLSGEADAVAINEFTGRDAIAEHNLQDKIRVLPQPMAVAGLHVVVHKSHPQAQDVLAMANDGLRGIRRSGEYQRIVEDHMSRIWANY